MQLICKENAEAKKQILQDLNAAEEQLKIALEENLQNEQSIRKEKCVPKPLSSILIRNQKLSFHPPLSD